jgi:hypothetical protein
VRAALHIPSDERSLNAALEGFARLAVRDLELHPDLPSLYRSGVCYEPELASEEWQLPSETDEIGAGDCEDLAAWRCAELRRRGEPARVVVRPGVRGVWHAIVRRGDGRIEDPSRRLGMLGGIGRDIEVNPTGVEWEVVPLREGGWRGVIRIPLTRITVAGDSGQPECVELSGVGITPGEAAGAALKLASTLQSNPVFKALVPAPVQWGLKAMGVVSRIARSGYAKRIFGKVFSKIRSGGLRRFARFLFR